MKIKALNHFIFKPTVEFGMKEFEKYDRQDSKSESR